MTFGLFVWKKQHHIQWKPQPNGPSIWISACILHNATQHFIIFTWYAWSACMWDSTIVWYYKMMTHPIWQRKKGKHTEWKMKLWNSALYFWCARVCLTIYTSFGVFPWISTLSLSPLIFVCMEMFMYVCIKTFIVTLSLNSIYLHFQNQTIIVLDNPSRHYCHIIVVNGSAWHGTGRNGQMLYVRFDSKVVFHS